MVPQTLFLYSNPWVSLCPWAWVGPSDSLLTNIKLIKCHEMSFKIRSLWLPAPSLFSLSLSFSLRPGSGRSHLYAVRNPLERLMGQGTDVFLYPPTSVDLRPANSLMSELRSPSSLSWAWGRCIHPSKLLLQPPERSWIRGTAKLHLGSWPTETQRSNE